MNRTEKQPYNYKTYDKITIYLEKGKKEDIRTYTNKKGISMNNFINELIEKAMNNNQV